MDFDKVFSEKEAYNILTNCMFTYDLGHFSFKPRLFFTKYEKTVQPYYMDYNTERKLLDALNIPTPNSIGFTGVCETELNEIEWNNIDGLHDTVSLALRHCNNYYIYLERLLKSLDEDVSLSKAISLKNTNIYKAICTLMIACSHYDSLVPHLKWLCSTMEDKPYEKVIELEYLKEGLEKNDIRGCNFIGAHYTNTLPVVPHSSPKYSVIFNNLDQSNVDQMFYEVVVFTLEILNRIESIKDQDIKDCIYNTFLAGTNTESKLMDKMYTKTNGKIQITQEALDVINIKDMEKRYYAIRDFARAHLKDVKDANIAYVNKPSDNGVNTMLCEYIKYCQTESIMNIRIKQIFILYNLAKEKGVLDKLDYSEVGQTEDDTGTFALPGGMFDAEESYSMLKGQMDKGSSMNVDVENNDSERKKVTEGVFYDELDKLASVFNDNGYTYNMESKFDNSNYRDNYNAICENAHLLTQSLIRSIKEIKVYNAGGKNPGKSSGKIDRKNLYKYKTSKDIFFDNTYKIRESDLAFGILLDVSGSMSGEGVRYGTNTMIVLTEVLKSLNINHSIVTHDSNSWHTCNLTRYQAFKEDKDYTCNRNYALANMRAGACNCDSGALHFMEKALLRTKNRDKICLIFSDGQPTECSDVELKEQVRAMERKGIKVIGIGINFPKIKEYYSNYANGSSLKEMFNIVSDILKEYVLEKIDEE